MANIRTIHRVIPRGIQSHSAGFTLIELMVVIALLVLIASMTVAAINLNVNNDKVRAGSRQVQSYLAGARDRAIYSKAPRGVRFLLTPTNSPTESSRTVSSMVFIAPTDPWKQGRVQLERLDDDSDDNSGNGIDHNPNNQADTTGGQAFVIRGYDNDPNYPPTEWVNLFQQGLLPDGARIQIPADNGTWYTITTDLLRRTIPTEPTYNSSYPPQPRLRLTTAYVSPPTNTNGSDVNAFTSGTGPQTYELELPPTVLPNQDPVLMPKGAVIHLDRCSSSGTQSLEMTAAGDPTNPATWTRADKIPFAWKRASTTGDPSGFDYTSRMDVLFSPRGVVIGQAAQRGIIHFYIADQKDADRDRLYWSSAAYPTASAPELGTGWVADPTYERGDKVILTLFTRTGNVSTHHIYSNSDPFRYAETGEVAGK